MELSGGAGPPACFLYTRDEFIDAKLQARQKLFLFICWIIVTYLFLVPQTHICRFKSTTERKKENQRRA